MSKENKQTVETKSVVESKGLEIKVKYFDENLPKIEKIKQGDWIDLRSAIKIEMKAGSSYLLPLGVAIQLPKGYEAHVAPRSSTFRRYGIIQTNSIGIIDESYCGDNDQWLMPIYATKDTVIEQYDRVCQFRIVEKMPEVNFKEVKELGNKDRNGIGSTGVK